MAPQSPFSFYSQELLVSLAAMAVPPRWLLHGGSRSCSGIGFTGELPFDPISMKSHLPPPPAQLFRRIRERRFSPGLACPRCRARSIQRWGRFRGRQRYRCSSCLRTFSDLTGTPLAYSKRASLWPIYVDCMREATSLREAARRTGIHPSTALRWRHRLLRAIRLADTTPFDGFIEVFEFVLPEARKGCRELGRPARTHSMEWCPWYVPRVFVSLVADRLGGTDGLITSDRPPGPAELDPLSQRLGMHAVLLAPRGRAAIYRRWCTGLGGRPRKVECVAAPAGPFRGDTGLWHRGTVTRLARAWREWKTRFRGVSTCYLPNYLAWFREIEWMRARAADLNWLAV